MYATAHAALGSQLTICCEKLGSFGEAGGRKVQRKKSLRIFPVCYTTSPNRLYDHLRQMLA